MKNSKKKGLSRQFTREVKSSDDLKPSDFLVIPRIIPRVELDDPLDKLHTTKPVKKEEKKPLIKPVKVEMPDKDKIKLIANKLNFLKKKKVEKPEKSSSEKHSPETGEGFLKRVFSKDQEDSKISDKKEEKN